MVPAGTPSSERADLSLRPAVHAAGTRPSKAASKGCSAAHGSLTRVVGGGHAAVEARNAGSGSPGLAAVGLVAKVALVQAGFVAVAASSKESHQERTLVAAECPAGEQQAGTAAAAEAAANGGSCRNVMVGARVRVVY